MTEAEIFTGIGWIKVSEWIHNTELAEAMIPIYGSLGTKSEDSLLEQTKKELAERAANGDEDAKRRERIWQEVVNASK